MVKFMLLTIYLTLYLSVDVAGSIQAPRERPPTGCKFAYDGRKELICTISKLSDCQNLLNTPYARNLFCPSAYGAAYTLKEELLTLLGPNARSIGAFKYYQTIPDVGTVPAGDEAQTIEPCLNVSTPWNPKENIGAGLPLCSLIARAASFNSRPLPGKYNDTGNPVISTNHFTKYLKNLIFPTNTSNIINFRENSQWDRLVKNLGASGAEVFSKMQPSFQNGSANSYNPWNLTTPPYYGISGGGGVGWGSEIGIGKSVFLEFGGGGGAGMTSSTVLPTRYGAGGGGGVNFGDGYTRSGVSYDGLGLGAGADSEGDFVTYSHYPTGNKGIGQPTYNATIVTAYITEMKILRATLKKECAAGKKIMYNGGGGAGAGVEFLRFNGQNYEPHALSTQAGFAFSFVITCSKKGPKSAPKPNNLYVELGKIYTKANNLANEKCGGWSDYGCICRTSHALVVAEVKRKYKEVPEWLLKSHCPPVTKPTPPNSPPKAFVMPPAPGS